MAGPGYAPRFDAELQAVRRRARRREALHDAAAALALLACAWWVLRG